MKNKIILFLSVNILFTASCAIKEETAPDNPTNITGFTSLQFPAHFPQPIYTMSDNKPTKAGFELGKKLFYDPILSRNNTISCGSCHISTSAFTHHGHDKSHGIDDLLGRRNTPPLQNLLWQPSYFWDGGVHNLDLVPLNAIQNPVEMDESPANVLIKLRAHPQYPVLFKQAFGSDAITSQDFLHALSQFMGMLISADSRYDKYKKGDANALSAEELAGLQLFRQKCASCHTGELFSDFSFRNNGLNSTFNNDKGRFEISLQNQDIGKFKVPSLRNIAKTAPYMHAGQLRSLDAVLQHYAQNVQYSTTLDTILQENGQLGIPMTAAEQQKIIAFLNTLTDETFIRDTRFVE
jgi:cytochrome c peroxidase